MVQNKYIVLVLVFFFYSELSFSQSQIIPLEHSLNNRVRGFLFQRNIQFHSSVQPYELTDSFPFTEIDSVLLIGRTRTVKHEEWLGRKMFQEHLFEYSTDEVSLYGDFLPNGAIGYDIIGDRSELLNSRGFIAAGSVGSSFSFYTEFFENQAKFPGYIDSYIYNHSVVPGQGFVKYFGDEGYDYSNSSALISYRPSQYLGIVGGHGKQFIGDGYRSLLLSDNAFNYPYIKLTADLFSFKYLVMWTEFQHIVASPGSESFNTQKKNGVFHYLDIHLSDCFTLGLFEGIIWSSVDSVNSTGFEWNYLNPIIFLRPVDFSIGSPGNVLVGLNASLKLSSNLSLYGQLILDEFSFKNLMSDNGYWGNKYGAQIGFRDHAPLNIKYLHFQCEFNVATPYTYSHQTVRKNYGHYNQPIAHPFGANFYEGLIIFDYTHNSIETRLQLGYSTIGIDTSSSFSVGQNIYKSYDVRVSDYGNYTTQGMFQSILYSNVILSYIVNPITNMRIELSATYRHANTSVNASKSFIVSLGVKSSFRNTYYDF